MLTCLPMRTDQYLYKTVIIGQKTYWNHTCSIKTCCLWLQWHVSGRVVLSFSPASRNVGWLLVVPNLPSLRLVTPVNCLLMKWRNEALLLKDNTSLMGKNSKLFATSGKMKDFFLWQLECLLWIDTLKRVSTLIVNNVMLILYLMINFPDVTV